MLIDDPSKTNEKMFSIRRKILDYKSFEEIYEIGPRHKKTTKYRLKSFAKRCLTKQYLKETVLRVFPFIQILSDYKLKRDLPCDIIAGITIGIIHIPQGMAYGLLASLTPIYGLYVAFFSIFIYFIFGSSKHLSFGAYAITTMMVGSCVEKHYKTVLNSTIETIDLNHNDTDLASRILQAKLTVATTVSLAVGLIQFSMGCLNLGFLTIFLSHPLTRGFTTGAGCHIFATQFKNLFGIKIQRYSGPLNLIYTYVDLFKNITSIIWASVIVSIICIIVLLLTKELINPRVKKYIKIPIPIELIIIVFAIIVSYYGDLNKKYKLDIVGPIKSGLPKPKLPNVSLISSIISEAITIAIVSVSSAVSLAKNFAKKHNYNINPNQELLAHGLGNIFISFFSCFVYSAIMSISLVQEGVGGKTQISGLISGLIILIVLIGIGNLFKHLPTAVLGAIIIVSLKGIFLQFQDLKKLWKVSKHDLATWLVVFLVTLIVDVDIGLIVGIGFALITVLQRSQRPYTSILGHIENTSFYRDITTSKHLKEFDNIKIIRFEASLYFTNKDYFIEKIYNRTKINPEKWLLKKKMLELKIEKLSMESNEFNKEKLTALRLSLESKKLQLHTIILDCSLMAFADTVGITTLDQIISEYDSIDIKFLLTNCNAAMVDVLEKSVNEFFNEKYLDNIYVTVHDALLSQLHHYGQFEKSNVFSNAIILKSVSNFDVI